MFMVKHVEVNSYRSLKQVVDQDGYYMKVLACDSDPDKAIVYIENKQAQMEMGRKGRQAVLEKVIWILHLVT
jgi:hypothetical protein